MEVDNENRVQPSSRVVQDMAQALFQIGKMVEDKYLQAPLG
jgi:hypothetical protein